MIYSDLRLGRFSVFYNNPSLNLPCQIVNNYYSIKIKRWYFTTFRFVMSSIGEYCIISFMATCNTFYNDVNVKYHAGIFIKWLIHCNKYEETRHVLIHLRISMHKKVVSFLSCFSRKPIFSRVNGSQQFFQSESTDCYAKFQFSALSEIIRIKRIVVVKHVKVGMTNKTDEWPSHKSAAKYTFTFRGDSSSLLSNSSRKKWSRTSYTTIIFYTKLTIMYRFYKMMFQLFQ